MNEAKRKRLEAKGCVIVEDAADWLGLTPAEREENALRGKLARAIWRFRYGKGATQKEAAKLIGTTQSRFAEIELGASASLDRMFNAYFTLGGTLAMLEDWGESFTESERNARIERPRRKVERPRVKHATPLVRGNSNADWTKPKKRKKRSKSKA